MFLGSVLTNMTMLYLLNKGFFIQEMLSLFGKSDIDILLNNFGEANGEDGGDGGIKFTPEQQKFVDKLIDTKANEFKQRYGDYETVKTKLSDYEKRESEKSQKDLEEAKKYDEAKKGYESKIIDAQKQIQERDKRIEDMNISYELTNEINKQNAYAEETLALIKSNAVIKDGKIRIKGKDSGGFDIEHSVEEGIKKFLESKPHLVKSNFRSGSGGRTGDGAGEDNNNGAGGGTQDINTLNAELMKAMQGTDLKKISELKQKIKAHHSSRGVMVGN